MQAPAPVRSSDNGESMLNRRSIPKAGRRVSPQRRVNAGIPMDWARLYILVLLAGLTFVGCGYYMPNIPPSLPGVRLVPGPENCRFVVRGDNAVWWGNGSGYTLTTEWVKTDPQSHEVLARIRPPYKANLRADATGFEAVWSAQGSYAPSVYKLDAQLKTPPVKISLGHSGWARRSVTHLAVGDHAVWATVGTPFTKVFRIDPDTLTIVAAIPGAGLVEAGEGAVWVSRGKHLVRIDPETNRITATIPLDI